MEFVLRSPELRGASSLITSRRKPQPFSHNIPTPGSSPQLSHPQSGVYHPIRPTNYQTPDLSIICAYNSSRHKSHDNRSNAEGLHTSSAVQFRSIATGEPHTTLRAARRIGSAGIRRLDAGTSGAGNFEATRSNATNV